MNASPVKAIAAKPPRKPFWLDKGVRRYVYGTGTVGRDVYRVLTNSGVSITGFMDHMRPDVPPTGTPPVLLPDDPGLTPEVRSQGAVILAIHNREVDMYSLMQRLTHLGYQHFVTMIDLYDRFADELGDRYWLAPRTLLASHESEIRSACSLLADEASRSLFSAVLRFRTTGDYSALPAPDQEHQYAPLDIPPWTTPLRLVDCGAYDGDTLRALLHAGMTIQAVGAFEPDPANFSRLCSYVKDNLNDLREAHLWPCAVDAVTRQVRFDVGHGEAGRMTLTGGAAIPSIALDDVLHGFSPNLIKLDVEGAEQAALLGARSIIAWSHPGLAVCVYHRPKDIWEIPLLIEELATHQPSRGKYKYFLRAHAYSTFDLVLYAVPVSTRAS